MKLNCIESILNYFKLLKKENKFKNSEALKYFEERHLKKENHLIWYNSKEIPSKIPMTNNGSESFNKNLKANFTNRLKQHLNVFLDIVKTVLDRFSKKEIKTAEYEKLSHCSNYNSNYKVS